MLDLAEYVDGLPNICGSEERIRQAMQASRTTPVFLPRVMLDYSGTLLYGLRQMGATDVLDTLARLTADERNRRAVEWLGCPWGHAVAPSTPVQDYRLHVEAWKHHFAAIFG